MARVKHVVRLAIMAVLAVLILTPLTVARISVHNVAYLDEQRHYTSLSRHLGTGNFAATPVVNGVAFSPDGKLLAGAYSNGAVRSEERRVGKEC